MMAALERHIVPFNVLSPAGWPGGGTLGRTAPPLEQAPVGRFVLRRRTVGSASGRDGGLSDEESQFGSGQDPSAYRPQDDL